MIRLGFTKPDGIGHTTLGWIHPELRLGFEVVANTPMDGTVDYRRLLLVERISGDAAFAVIPIENLIADRMGQYASGTAPEMHEQARILFQLHPELDMEYLERRIRQETGTIMASPTSTTEERERWAGRVVRHDDFANTLSERRQATGEPQMLRNAGNRRTPSKAALLDAIKDAGGEW